MKGGKPAVRAALLATPQLLGYSLEARILPRLRAMVEAGITPYFVAHYWPVVSSFTSYCCTLAFVHTESHSLDTLC